MKKPRIKVCGLTREQDIELIDRYSIDAAGLIFHPASRRRLSIATGKSLRGLIPPSVLVFAVVKADIADRLLRIADRCRVDVVQIHGSVSDNVILKLQREGYRVALSCNPATKQHWEEKVSDFILFDNHASGEAGGTGVPFDWKSVRPPYPKNLILAGGLSQDNVTAGIKKFLPMMVDLNSGIESAPGIKSATKLARIVRTIREKHND